MKTKFLKQVVLLMIPLLTLFSTNAWGTAGDVITLIDFTQTGNWGHSTYSDSWDLTANHNSSGNIACVAQYAVSNNETILRAGGGKNALITNQLSYIGTQTATTVPVSTFSVNVTTVTSSANLTINSVKLYVYSNSTFTTQIDCVDQTANYATGAVNFTPTSGSVWASGVYFKLVWDLSTTATGSNVYTAINKLQITEGSTKTLSSIALKTSATKTAYVAGEDFAAAGMVITATYSDASTEDIDYDSNSAKFSFSPSTSLTAGTTSVTVTYGGKTCTQTIAVYAVTVQAKDENGDAIAAGGPGAPSRTGASITCAADALNYKFWKWEVTNASVASSTNKTTTISSPTGAVTVTAKYYLPRTVTWKVNGETWTPSEHSGTDGTSEVKRETTWSALTLPDDPTTSDGCGQKFMGWTPAEIDGSLDKTDDADAISTLEATGLLNSDNKSSKSTSTYKIMNNTTFHAVFADYAE